MIDLDSVLRQWAGKAPAGWDEGRAVAVAEDIATVRSLEVVWEPGDEEWVHLVEPRTMAQISKRFPLALVVGIDLAELFRSRHPDVAVVVISDSDAVELRASPDVLRRTVLSDGWTSEFDPAGFSTLDLFLESV